MWKDSWVAFDTETTGVNGQARILEIGIVYFENGKPVDQWSTFLNPPDLDWNHPDVKSALEVNQITREMCAEAPSFEQAWPDILVRITEDVLVGHNLAFDKRMLLQELERLGHKFEYQWALEICTMCTSYRLDPTAQRHKLDVVAARWGVQPENAHRAVVDALTSGQVLQKMIESGRLPIQEPDVVSFQKEAAVAWQRRPRRRF